MSQPRGHGTRGRAGVASSSSAVSPRDRGGQWGPRPSPPTPPARSGGARRPPAEPGAGSATAQLRAAPRSAARWRRCPCRRPPRALRGALRSAGPPGQPQRRRLLGPPSPKKPRAATSPPSPLTREPGTRSPGIPRGWPRRRCAAAADVPAELRAAPGPGWQPAPPSRRQQLALSSFPSTL